MVMARTGKLSTCKFIYIIKLFFYFDGSISFRENKEEWYGGTLLENNKIFRPGPKPISMSVILILKQPELERE